MLTKDLLSHYREKERTAFGQIPGMSALLSAAPDTFTDISALYPDAAFALRVSGDLFQTDRELSLINQRAYFSILNGDRIADVQYRYGKEMDQYVHSHMWDD